MDKDLERDLYYIQFSKEELEEILPDGGYQISAEPFFALTGKGGYITYLMLLKNSLQEWKIKSQ